MRKLSYNRIFPTPKYFSLSSVGLDFSDRTLRFVELFPTKRGLRIKRYGEEKIPEGLVRGGRIMDDIGFSNFLSEVREKHSLKYVRVSLPEEHVYSFIAVIEAVYPEEIRTGIELQLEDNIPVKPAEAVFDFSILKQEGTKMVVLVVAAAEQLVNSYYDTFLRADLIPVSFELEAGAIARSAVPVESDKAYMVVDFGEMKTGISIVSDGKPIYASTLEVGGAILTQMISKEAGIPIDEAENMKKNYGLTSPEENKKLFSILVNGLSTLKDEINRRYIYWHTKKTELMGFPNIEKVLLCGGDANLKGLPDYLAVNLKLPVEIVNPWQNLFSLDEVVPNLNFQQSMSYVTAIGLALGDYDYD